MEERGSNCRWWWCLRDEMVMLVVMVVVYDNEVQDETSEWVTKAHTGRNITLINIT